MTPVTLEWTPCQGEQRRQKSFPPKRQLLSPNILTNKPLEVLDYKEFEKWRLQGNLPTFLQKLSKRIKLRLEAQDDPLTETVVIWLKLREETLCTERTLTPLESGELTPRPKSNKRCNRLFFNCARRNAKETKCRNHKNKVRWTNRDYHNLKLGKRRLACKAKSSHRMWS